MCAHKYTYFKINYYNNRIFFYIILDEYKRVELFKVFNLIIIIISVDI